MNKTLIALCLATTYMAPIAASAPPTEAIENHTVARINVIMETLPKGTTFSQESVVSRMRTKIGDPFSQIIFDQDLKALTEEYERAEPSIDVKSGEVYITIKLWQRPIIRQIKWSGNKYFKSQKLQKELGIKAHTRFNRDDFNAAFNKVKEFYIKRGYFDAHLHYKMNPDYDSNTVDIEITVEEGASGHVGRVIFNGFSTDEESALLEMIQTKKYNLLTSWVTGKGIYHEEMLEQDRLVIVDYLQNEGYADARVEITVRGATKTDDIFLIITAHRGEVFEFGAVTFTGNTLFQNDKIHDSLSIDNGSRFSQKSIRESVEGIKDLYGKKGYIDTNVTYNLRLAESAHTYNVHFEIEESEQYKIGLIRVLGNTSTKTNVILRESYLTPGEVFDSRRLKATQDRLEAMGYFKSVNVYPIRSSHDSALGPEYRDVVIEVEETMTGSASLFGGGSSSDGFFGGLDFTENNFNYRGLSKFWKDFSALRGGGEYLHLRAQFGKKQSNYTVSWVDPYWRDSLWSIGLDANYSSSDVTSNDYDVRSYGGSVFGSYPLSNRWKYGWKARIRRPLIDFTNEGHLKKERKSLQRDVDSFNGNPNPDNKWQNEKVSQLKDINERIEAEKREERNSGLVYGWGSTISYDTVDNVFRPRRGLRSTLDAEIDGVHRSGRSRKIGPKNTPITKTKKREDGSLKEVPLKYDDQNFPMLRFVFNNSYYYPVWRKGTIKLRGDAMFIQPLGEGKGETVPMSERFFLGGENSVRGFKPGILGPKIDKDEPLGGISAVLLSAEYMQNVSRFLDYFVFVDAGSVALSALSPKSNFWRASYGGGIRLDIGQRLPLIFGYGVPLHAKKGEKKNFFFQMGGQF